MLKAVATIRTITFLLAGIITVQAYATDITFTMTGTSPYCGTSGAIVNYDGTGITFDSGNIFAVQLSNATGSFTAPTFIGALSSTDATGAIAITFPNSASGNGYRIRILSNKPWRTSANNGFDLTLIPTSSPTVTISGQAAICSGAAVEFSATPVNGGTTPSYQWKKNGGNVGISSSVYTDNTLADGDEIHVVMTSNRGCLSTPTATSNSIDVHVLPVVVPAISIAPDPSSTVGAGSVIYFASTITNGGTSPVIEWKKNGNVVGTGSSYVLPSVAHGDEVVANLTSNSACAAPAAAMSNTVNVDVDENLTRSNHAWEERAGQPDGGGFIGRTNASGFSIGATAYIGCGSSTTDTYRKDFWAYDPVTDTWTQKVDFAGAGRYNAIGFSVGTKGYIGTGRSATGVMNDFYEYEPTNNNWQVRKPFPGPAREQAFGFGISSGSKVRGYIGGGSSTVDFKDFYEYNPSGDNWASKTDFSGNKRIGAGAFSIGAKGFVVGGFSSSSNTWYKDLWEYDQSQNLWMQRASMPGNGRTRPTAFALAGNGYAGLGYSPAGYDGSFYQYNLSTNTWITKPAYPGPATQTHGVGVSLIIGNRAFVYKDGTWMEYNLFTTSAFASKVCATETIPVSFDASAFVFANDNTFTAQISLQRNFSVKTTLALKPSTSPTGTLNAVIPATVESGTYYFKIDASNPSISSPLEMVTVTKLPASHSITSVDGATVCKDVAVTFDSDLSGVGFQWLKNNVAVGTDNASYIDASLLNGDVIKCIRNYETGCASPVGVPSNTITMTVRAPATPTVTVNQPNILVSSTATRYQWFQNDAPISNATGQNYTMTESGVYKVRITDGGGCMAFSEELANAFTGLEDDWYDLEVSTYPSPFSTDMVLALSDNIVGQGCNYSMLNDLGQTIIDKQPAQRFNKLDMSGKAPGLYILHVSFGQNTVVRRLVKVN